MVQERLAGEQIEDFAICHPWSTTWPTFTGIGVAAIGAFVPFDNAWILASGLLLSFGLLLAGALLMPAVLIVTTPREVLVMEGRRRTYEPMAVLDRVDRRSWSSREQIRSRGLWVPPVWKRHLPKASR